MNTPIISICGLDCSTCPAFIAYKTNDDELRAKTAKEWAEEYDSPGLKPENMNCSGCLSREEPIYDHCKVCEVRKCGMEKGVKNCGECLEYSNCEIIINFHKQVPEAKEACDTVSISSQ